MSFFARLFGGRSQGAEAADREGLHVYVSCDRCGEQIHVRANRRTDVSQEYDDAGAAARRVLHKEILGSRCQNLMYAHLTLDAAGRIADAQTEGCTLITREQFEAAP